MKISLYDASKLMLRIVAVLLVMAFVTDTDGKNGGMMTVGSKARGQHMA
jgi:hypothetical protein